MRRQMTEKTYRIRIRSHLDLSWVSWFEGLHIQHDSQWRHAADRRYGRPGGFVRRTDEDP